MHVRYIHAIEACVARYSRHYSLTMLCFFFSLNVSTTPRRSSSRGNSTEDLHNVVERENKFLVSFLAGVKHSK